MDINVRIDFPALDKIATLLCVSSDRLLDSMSAFVNERMHVTAKPVAEAAEPMPEAQPEAPEKPAEDAKIVPIPTPAEPPVTVEEAKPEAEEAPAPEAVEAPVSTAEETAAEETAAEAPEANKVWDIREIQRMCYELHDLDASNAMKIKNTLREEYQVGSLAELRANQDNVNRFAEQLIAMGARA